MCDIKAIDIIHWQNAMMELETDKKYKFFSRLFKNTS